MFFKEIDKTIYAFIVQCFSNLHKSQIYDQINPPAIALLLPAAMWFIRDTVKEKSLGQETRCVASDIDFYSDEFR